MVVFILGAFVIGISIVVTDLLTDVLSRGFREEEVDTFNLVI